MKILSQAFALKSYKESGLTDEDYAHSFSVRLYFDGDKHVTVSKGVSYLEIPQEFCVKFGEVLNVMIEELQHRLEKELELERQAVSLEQGSVENFPNCFKGKSDFKSDKFWLYEFAGRAMQGLMSDDYNRFLKAEAKADIAVSNAKVLLERLKKEEV